MLFRKLPLVFSLNKFTSKNTLITRLINNTKIVSGGGGDAHKTIKPIEDRSKLPESEKYEWERETRTVSSKFSFIFCLIMINNLIH
jgi:hypothetical protein